MDSVNAWRFTARGLPRDVLSLEPIPVPTLPPSVAIPKEYQHKPWVLVRVSYAALNLGGFYGIAIFLAISRAKTLIPEIEFSGIVLDTLTVLDSKSAADGLHVQKGDAVAGMIPTSLGATGIGALATHVAIPADLVVKLPNGVFMRDAAGIMLTGMTAIRMARDAGIQPGHRVLVNSASGGVGTMAVQVARDIVGQESAVTVCSGKNAEIVKKLGADEVGCRYAKTNAQQFDCVLDCIGIQNLYNASAAFLKPERTYVVMIVKPQAMSLPSFAFVVGKILCNIIWPTSRSLAGAGRKWKTVYMMDTTRDEREQLVRMVAEGRLSVVVDSIWGFRDVLGGYDVLWSGRAKGKVVVRVDGNEK
jgi:NADPH:quinone reductase-like Zn-dependent oxidoreductase